MPTYDSSYDNSPITRVALTDSSGQPIAGSGGSGASSNQVQGAAAHDAAVAGNPLLEGGYASDAAPTDVADGDAVRAWNKRNGARATYQAYKLDPVNDAVTSYPFGHTSTYISTATTTTVKSGSGVLHTVIVNGGTAGTVTIYDNTAGSGTIIAAFDSTNALNTYMFNVAFTTGLTIVTAAATKLTVSSR